MKKFYSDWSRFQYPCIKTSLINTLYIELRVKLFLLEVSMMKTRFSQ